MKSDGKDLSKELYKQLRAFSCVELWNVEVPRFDKATPAERSARVSLIRAVGVVFAEHGSISQKTQVREWLKGLLNDPAEKIRRYAMAALPKLGAGEGEEAELLKVLDRASGEREKKFLGRALGKIGGEATLQAIRQQGDDSLGHAALKVQANVARNQSPTHIQLDQKLTAYQGLLIHLRGRRGLEQFMRAEVEEKLKRNAKFRMTDVRSGLVALMPVAPFTLADIYALRCFGSVGFVLGSEEKNEQEDSWEALAQIIGSTYAQRILTAFTTGSLRYRLDFVGKGHQRGAVQTVANRAYALNPGVINDPQEAPWTISVYPQGRRRLVELSPKSASDPRFTYRQQDVPAASHPPLAACLARMAGREEHEVVWDPFCGSGIELIERSLLGGVDTVYGSDLSAEAVDITEKNIAAANLKLKQAKVACVDFRDFAKQELGPESVSLIISNPPLGKRVPIPNLRGLIYDLIDVAAMVLKPGGRLVFANPIPMENPPRLLKLRTRQVVDFGGFDCRVEKYVKS
ncbi:MAG TPA: methyltransferase domain-containing protein [Verrucomicrobiae bacterium]